MADLFAERGNHRIFTHTEDVNRTTEKFVIASEMECDALIQENRRLRQDRESGDRRKETFRLVARFPAPIVEQAMQEGWFHDDDEWAKKVNDPQYRDFRVAGGRF
jgi:hypothetical protein